jgi:serine protease inhibitor
MRCSAFYGEIAWFDARVLRVAIFNEINPIKTEYIVHYDIEDDNTTWNFPLLSDLKNGDLIVKRNTRASNHAISPSSYEVFNK